MTRLANKAVYVSNGNFWIGTENISRSDGFKTGEIVTVALDMEKGVIKYKVGAEIRYEGKLPILSDRKIGWVPYIYLHQSDSV